MILAALASCVTEAPKGKSDTGSWHDECCLPRYYSTSITVVDSDGNTNLDAQVTYSVDGSEEETAICQRLVLSSECILWSAGFEETGTFVVTATAEGYTSASETVTVALDEYGCNVVPVPVDLVLSRPSE